MNATTFLFFPKGRTTVISNLPKWNPTEFGIMGIRKIPPCNRTGNESQPTSVSRYASRSYAISMFPFRAQSRVRTTHVEKVSTSADKIMQYIKSEVRADHITRNERMGKNYLFDLQKQLLQGPTGD